VTNIENDVEYDYYCSIYSHIKSHMQNKNSYYELRPPQGDRKDDNVSIADIISSEEEWVYHRQMPWKSRYRPSDFMGVSQKVPCGQCVSEANAVNRTIEAWDIAALATTFQQTGTHRPAAIWFDGYAEQIRAQRSSSSSD
jgi:hypothetical protein